MSASRVDYSQLRVQEDDSNHLKIESCYIQLSRWTAYGIIIATGILSLISLLLPSTYLFEIYPTFQPARRPLSQYINLKESYHELAQATDPIFSYAQIVLQFDSSDPKKRLREDSSRQVWTPEGTVYPDDRHLIVSTNTSTIVQLRSRSFGFERCAVAAILPNRTKTLDPAITVHSKSLLDLWQLDTDEEISPYVMDSWKFSARRRRLLGQFYFLDNDTWTSAEFPCPPGTFFTFEVACSKTVSGCHVDFWQDRESPNGLYLKQFR